MSRDEITIFRTAFLVGILATALPVKAAPIRDLGRTFDGPPSEGDRSQSGFFDLGTYIINHGGAASARPEGSGSALFQYHGYIDDAVNGDRFKFLADLLFLTDRLTALAVKPQSFDYLLGASSRSGNTKIQFDREEYIPLDISGKSYRNWDVRGSYLLNYAPAKTGQPWNKSAPYGLSGVLSVGYFLHNNDTPARLDNSGLAFMRYRAGLSATFLGGALLFRGDADFLTDQNRRYAPADLDLALGIGTFVDGAEIMIYRKSREALDRSGYAGYYLLSIRKYFDSRSK